MSKYTRKHSPYSGVKTYQATPTLFRNQDVPGSKNFIQCKNLPGNIALFSVKIYQAAYALIGCQEIPGNTALFGCQETTGNITLFGVKIYQAAYALFGCQDIPGISLIRFQDIQGNIRLIRESRCTRRHSPYSVSRYTRHLPYSVIKFYQAFTSLRVSCFTIHVHNNFIPGNSGI